MCKSLSPLFPSTKEQFLLFSKRFTTLNYSLIVFILPSITTKLALSIKKNYKS